MYTILERKELAPEVKLFEVFAPRVAKTAEAGQFVILRTDEKGERIPLTIADFNREKGTITIIFQEVGRSTKKLGGMMKGDSILNFLGPLGCPSEIEDYGTVVCIGGGIGVAPLYPIAKALRNVGNRVISIIGARNRDLLILEREMRDTSDEIYITTDDGSKGHHGFVSDVLKELIVGGENIDRIFTIGPLIMMKVVSEISREHGIKTIASLNPIMIDGTGMCGGCRVSVGNEIKFACVDGPEFDAHKVDFDTLMKRNKRFSEEERI
jgi:ferredoxin--NADP+ reductase